jgi:hypothetical protein
LLQLNERKGTQISWRERQKKKKKNKKASSDMDREACTAYKYSVLGMLFLLTFGVKTMTDTTRKNNTKHAAARRARMGDAVG